MLQMQSQDRCINGYYYREMDLVHDRARNMEEEDRISNLPNGIIHHILSFLDMKYAIQTSTLSKKWKHIWTSMPHLNLNSETFCTLPLFAKFVNDALSHRNHLAEVLEVELSFRGAATQFYAFVRSIVNYVYSHNVRKLAIEWFRLNNEVFKFPQRLFSCHTLKHLTLATHHLNGIGLHLPLSAWDFPALETLNLSNLALSDYGCKSLDLFSKCVNLKDLTLHRCSMYDLDIFYVCAPLLSNLTITDSYIFPRVFGVVAPRLENLTLSLCDSASSFMQFSPEGMYSLVKVSLSMQTLFFKNERYARLLGDLFLRLSSAQFLILDKVIIEVLSAFLYQLSYQGCWFSNLKCLKQKDHTPIPIEVRNYLCGNSPIATSIMDLPQVPHKRSIEEVDKGTVAKTSRTPINFKNQLLKSYPSATFNMDLPQVSHKRSRQEVDKDKMAKKMARLDEEKQQKNMAEEMRSRHEALSSCPNQLSHEPSLSSNLKCLRQTDHIPRMPTQVRNYLHERSSSTTLLMGLPQKITRQEVDKGTMAKKLEEEKHQLETMAEEKRSRNMVDRGTPIKKALPSCLDQLLHEPSHFNNLEHLRQVDSILRMATQVRSCLHKNAPNTTFLMDLPQLLT